MNTKCLSYLFIDKRVCRDAKYFGGKTAIVCFCTYLMQSNVIFHSCFGRMYQSPLRIKKKSFSILPKKIYASHTLYLYYLFIEERVSIYSYSCG